MRESDWNKIQENIVAIVRDLDPSGELISYLYQDKVLSDHNRDCIDAEKTRSDKVHKLLDILHRANVPGGDVYAIFYRHLGQLHPHLANLLKPPGRVRSVPASVASKDENEKYIRNLGVEDTCKFLEPILQKIDISDPGKVLGAFRDQKINGRVFLNISTSELSEICRDLKFGDRKMIIIERDEFIQENKIVFRSDDPSDEPKCGLEQREYPRKFDTSVALTEKYTKGKVLENLQSSVGNLIDPVHYCVSLGENIDVESALETIGWETVKFTASCMNDRTNGTLHFGVHDGLNGLKSRGYIEGISYLNKQDCDEAISSRVRKGFDDEKVEQVNSCLSPSRYIDVVSNKEIVGFVLELDVKPKAQLVGDQVYYIRDEFMERGMKEPTKQLYRLQDAVPTKLDVKDVGLFLQTKGQLTKQRNEFEQTVMHKSYPRNNLLQRLQEFFCDGDKTMGDVYPVLVLSSIDQNITMDEIQTKFPFISQIDWICIFDFDPTSSEKGIYKFLEEKHNLEFRVKHTDDFDPRRSYPQQQTNDDKLLEEMTSSNLKPYIFCNGHGTLEKPQMDVMKWKAKRSEGFKEAVRYFAHQIPIDRAKVVHLLLSKDYNVMLEGAEELCLKFQNQWIVMAETDSIAAQWQEQLICRKVTDRATLEHRLIVGYKWEDIGKCLKEITGTANNNEITGECSLVSSLGPQINLPKNFQNKFCDIEVLSATECTKLDMLHEEERTRIAKDNETNFYQGHQPSWVNFYLANHVLRRQNHMVLLHMVDDVLKGNIPDNVNIGRVNISHQPGSGGSTTAKQVLWDMKENVRCCILKSYSKESYDQIANLWKYGEEDPMRALPVLVMIDNLDDDKLQELAESLQDEANKHLQGSSRVMCVLLICHRQSTFPSQRDHMTFFLKQNLTPEEKNWFQSKYNDLAESFKKQRGPNPKNLLSLNIMKENFSEKYIKNTVEEILNDITLKQEKFLLKYVSLLNAYDNKFRSIPVPCFDSLMQSRGLRNSRRWELCLSTPVTMLILCSKGTKQPGLRIVNPLLSKWVLNSLIKQEEQNLSDAMLEFLHSSSCQFPYTDVAFSKLKIMLREMMKTREITATGKPEMFSRIIQELYDSKYVDAAAEILEFVYEKTNDPYIAQQLARLFIVCENWDKARDFANEATSRKPDSSYLWDTHGQIFKLRLAKLFDSGITANQCTNQKLMQEGVELAYEGVARFKKVQELSCNESQTNTNTAGYTGEIEICISLFDLLCLIPEFKHKSRLQDFLNGKTNAPAELALLTPKQLFWLKELGPRVMATMRNLEDEADRYRTEHIAVDSRTHRYFLKDNLDRLRLNLGSYFGDINLQNFDAVKSLPADKRREQVQRFGIYSLKSIFKITKHEDAKERIMFIYRLMLMNAKLQKPSAYECRVALGTALALGRLSDSSCELPNFEDLLQISVRLYGMEESPNYIDLEPFLYLVLLHWPTDNRKHSRSLCRPEILLNAISRWKDAYAQKCPKDRRANRPRDRPFLFITKREGVESIAHIEQMMDRHGPGRSQLRRILETRDNQHLLCRFQGKLIEKGWNVSLQFETVQGNKLPPVSIPLYMREPRQSLWNKKVFFVLGFDWSGPKACNIQAEFSLNNPNPMKAMATRRPNPRHQFMMTTHQSISQQIMVIDQHLRHISILKTTPRNQLQPEQFQLLLQENMLLGERNRLHQERWMRFHESL